MLKLGGMFLTSWQKSYFSLYTETFEWRPDPFTDKANNTIHLDELVEIKECRYKDHSKCIRLDVLYRKNKTRTPDLVLLRCETEMEFDQWMKHLTRNLEDYRYQVKMDSTKRLSADTETEDGWALVDSFESSEGPVSYQIN